MNVIAFMQGRSLVNVITTGNLFQTKNDISHGVSEILYWEKILLDVINMEKPLAINRPSIDSIMDFIQNRNPMDVLTVGNSSFLMHIRASVDVYYL